MASVGGGFQPDTKSPSSRRADFDLQRRIAALEANGGSETALPPGGDPGEILVIDGNGDPVWAPDSAPTPTDHPPAYIGPRYDAPSHAQFSHVNAGGGIGYEVDHTGQPIIVAAPGTGVLFYGSTGTMAAPATYIPWGRFDSGGRLLIGKSTSDGTTVGAELHPFGMLVNVVGTAAGTAANQFLNHIEGRDANASMFINFGRSNVNIGSVTQVGTTGVAFNTASDYRLKNEIGPVPDALARLHDLRPIRFAWKSDGTEVDGFLAHEVQAVVPEAVTGTKDQIDDEGNPMYQGIDQSKLVPLLIAAVQELAAQVAALQAAP